MSDMANHAPDAAPDAPCTVTASPTLPGAEAVADILRDMRAKERELWLGEPPRMGCFAVALMLDAYIDRLAVAIGEAPPPKEPPGGGELDAARSPRGEDDDDDTVDIGGIMADPDYLPGDVAIAIGL